MTEQEIQRALGWHYGIKRGCIPIPNVLMDYGRYEADFIYINQNNYLTEIEIKVSFQDFKADFTKNIITIVLMSVAYTMPYLMSFIANIKQKFTAWQPLKEPVLLL